MEPLLKTAVVKKAEDKDIKIKFTVKGNKHLYSDTFGRVIFDKNDLKYLDKFLEKSEFVSSADISKKRKDKIVKFYYFKDNIKNIYYNVAKEVIKHNGAERTSTYLYSMTKSVRQ